MREDRQPVVNRLLKYVWNLPNEVIGKGLGYAGHGIGTAAHAVGLQKNPPRIEYDSERRMTNFINSPLTPLGALTIGRNTMWNADPDIDPRWIETERARGQSVRDHEASHAPQAEQLGPLYLPSNLLGGLTSTLFDYGHKDWPWHGPSNWNETGPLMNPPRPWAGRGEK